jgi:hypothetical protein
LKNRASETDELRDMRGDARRADRFFQSRPYGSKIVERLITERTAVGLTRASDLRQRSLRQAYAIEALPVIA